ncbi:MAG: dUTP diphosphatase [Clostridia bacterium]|jgi:dUTP pyrophosphatase|nr:dUTP diphosphatase [Clostridia bacterium]NLS85740.1 dUTP diphosphatase [Oscillospiraceae bacterium]
MQIKIKLVRDGAQMPRYATNGAAAADLCAVCADEGITLEAGARALVPTGVAIELPSAEYAAFIYARSGLAVKRGLALSNGVGVIDSDYRGEISVGLVNLSTEPYTIQNGERIAQMCIQPVIIADFTAADDLSSTTRGAGGFGSTGKV